MLPRLLRIANRRGGRVPLEPGLDELDRGEESADELVELEPLLDPRQPGRVAARLGKRAREQRAAILGREVRDLQRSELLGLSDDLSLVPAEQRAEQRQVARVLDNREVVQRLACDLTERVAGHDRAGALAPSEDARHAD